MSARAEEEQREKQRRYRSRLRKRGLRPVQIWVPDTRARGFAAECRRQALRISRSPSEVEALDFIVEVADWGEK